MAGGEVGEDVSRPARRGDHRQNRQGRGSNNRQYGNNKRPHDRSVQQHSRNNHNPMEEASVDDLMIAASYAVAVAPTFVLPVSPSSNIEPGIDECDSSDDDSNEIDIDSGTESANSDHPDKVANENISDAMPSMLVTGNIGSDKAVDMENNRDELQQEINVGDNVETAQEKSAVDGITKNDDADDDESDVDLGEQLARMIEDGDGEDDDDYNVESRNGNKIKSIPMTANEVDGYHADIQQLESVLQWSLHVNSTCADKAVKFDGVEATDESRQGKETNQPIFDLTSLVMEPAGHIMHHIVEDRTVIIEGNGNHISGIVLDEGTLLILQIDSSDPNVNNDQRKHIPMGKIFEVFGPIRQPLYSIRLPPPPPSQSSPTICASNKKKQQQQKGKQQRSKKNNLAKSNGKTPTDDTTAGDAAISNSPKSNTCQEKTDDVDDVQDPMATSETVDNSSDQTMVADEETKELDQEQLIKPAEVKIKSILSPATFSPNAEDAIITEENSAVIVSVDTEAAKEPSGTETIKNSILEDARTEPCDETTMSNVASEPSSFIDVSQSGASIDRPDVVDSHQESTTTTAVDPWSKNGEYTKWIQTKLSRKEVVTVYYVPAKTNNSNSIGAKTHDVVGRVLDTSSILRNNRRGCDASNVFDEEVSNVNEMDFSDDEQERNSRSRNKNSKKEGTNRGNREHQDYNHHHDAADGGVANSNEIRSHSNSHRQQGGRVQYNNNNQGHASYQKRQHQTSSSHSSSNSAPGPYHHQMTPPVGFYAGSNMRPGTVPIRSHQQYPPQQLHHGQQHYSGAVSNNNPMVLNSSYYPGSHNNYGHLGIPMYPAATGISTQPPTQNHKPNLIAGAVQQQHYPPAFGLYGSGGIPPPPPPPHPPVVQSQPQAPEEESDTVYYDY